MKNDLNVEIGKRVREQRVRMGYTREQFAEALDISSRFAADIELGSRGMSFSTLIRLCKLLSVSSDYILMGKPGCSPESRSEVNRIISCIDDKYIPYVEELLRIIIKLVNID